MFLFFSLDLSHFSDSSFECFSTNPLTGSVCACRRSPRLLANGYYVLTEDSFSTDDEGNVTLTPSHTSISYKENLVRWVYCSAWVFCACVCSDLPRKCLKCDAIRCPDMSAVNFAFNQKYGTYWFCLIKQLFKNNTLLYINVTLTCVCMCCRIFRRRRKARRSLASLLSDVSQSCQSWLEASVFRRSDPVTPLQSSSWMELDNTFEKDEPISFTYG